MRKMVSARTGSRQIVDLFCQFHAITAPLIDFTDNAKAGRDILRKLDLEVDNLLVVVVDPDLAACFRQVLWL